MPYGKKNFKKVAKRPLSRSARVVSSKRVVSPTLKKIVKRMISATEEIKQTGMTIAYKNGIMGQGFNNNPAVNTGYSNTTCIIPQIGQGTLNNQKVGNVVIPKSCVVRGYLNALPITANGGTNPYPNVPFYVKVIVYRLKVNMTSNFNEDIMDDAGAYVPFSGFIDDLLLPLNTEKYAIAYNKTFKLQAPPGTAGTNTNSNIGSIPTAKMFKVNLLKHLPKKLKYTDTSLDPTNARWFISAGIVPCDGNSTYLTTEARAWISCESLIKFTDA